MAIPARTNIIENCKTTLEGILKPTYKTNVKTVEVQAKGRDDIRNQNLRPFVGVVPGLESFEYQPSNCMRVSLEISTVGVITGRSREDRTTALNDLLDDMIAVMHVDQTRGGNAVSTTLVSSETDEGDPDAEDDGQMVNVWKIVYFRDRNSS